MKLQTQLIHTLKMPICEFIRKRNDMSNNRKCIGRLAGLYYGIDGIPKEMLVLCNMKVIC